MANRIILNEMSFFGRGCIGVIADEIKRRGYKKILVVTDKALIGIGPVEAVIGVLKGADIPHVVFSELKPNPSIKNVQDGVAACKQAGADAIVAIGGGSAIDTAKGIGIIVNNPEFEPPRVCRRHFRLSPMLRV